MKIVNQLPPYNNKYSTSNSYLYTYDIDFYPKLVAILDSASAETRFEPLQNDLLKNYYLIDGTRVLLEADYRTRICNLYFFDVKEDH